MLSAHRVTKKLQGICQNQGNKNQRLGFLTFKSEEYLQDQFLSNHEIREQMHYETLSY